MPFWLIFVFSFCLRGYIKYQTCQMIFSCLSNTSLIDDYESFLPTEYAVLIFSATNLLVTTVPKTERQTPFVGCLLKSVTDIFTVHFGYSGHLGPHLSGHYTVHFGYSGHLGPHLSGHYIRLATISDLNIIE